jgi:localization factor PodJL
MAQQSRWSVSGIQPESRVAAKVAARRAGLTIGEWLSRVIMDAAKASVQGQELAPLKSQLPVAPANEIPAVPMNELTGVIAALSDLIQKQNERAETAMGLDRTEVEETMELSVAPVKESVRQLEENIDAKFEALQLGENVGPMQDRVREAEAKAERANLAMAPLERKVMRLSQELQQRQEEALTASRPTRPPRRGLLSRLFGD